MPFSIQAHPNKLVNRGKIQSELDTLVRLFRVLSDQTRLRILMTLAMGERGVSDLVNEFNLRQPTMSHHLGLLRMNDLIGNRRDGKRIFYSLASHLSHDGNQLKIKIDGHEVVICKRD